MSEVERLTLRKPAKRSTYRSRMQASLRMAIRSSHQMRGQTRYPKLSNPQLRDQVPEGIPLDVPTTCERIEFSGGSPPDALRREQSKLNPDQVSQRRRMQHGKTKLRQLGMEKKCTACPALFGQSSSCHVSPAILCSCLFFALWRAPRFFNCRQATQILSLSCFGLKGSLMVHPFCHH